MADTDLDSSDVSDLLPFYVITACFRKMYRRFTHERLSAPYLQSLKSVVKENIAFLQSEPEISPTDLDRSFFLEFLPLLHHTILSRVPNLLEIIRKAKDPSELDGPVYFYTKDTCKEFHYIFMHLLDAFDKSLAGLQVNSKKGAANSNDFRHYVIVLNLVGTVLQVLTKGTVLRIHLKTIESSLEEHRRREAPKKAEQDGKDGQDGDNGQDEGQDEDLQAVQPCALYADSIQPMALYESYREWLKLMLVHFDAIDVLKGFFATADRGLKINMKILVSPPSSTASLPWQEIFKSNSNILLPNPNHDKLIKHYEGVLTSDFSASTSRLQNALKSLRSNEPDRYQKHIKAFTEKTSVPGWKAWAEVLKTKTGKELEEEISSMLEGNQLRFYKYLIDEVPENAPKFGGVIHCEASLASLLKVSKRNLNGNVTYDEIRAKLGVSFTFPTCLCHQIFISCNILGFWTSYRSIKTLLSNMSYSPLSPSGRQKRAVPCERVSQFCERMYSSPMASVRNCGPDEFDIRFPVETGTH
jgi:hypothetical protein